MDLKELVIKTPLKFKLIDFLVFQLDIALPGLSLSKTHKVILAYYYMYDNAVSKVIEDEVLTSEKSCMNYVSDLRKTKLLIGKGKETKVNPKIKLQTESFKLNLTIINEEEVKLA